MHHVPGVNDCAWRPLWCMHCSGMVCFTGVCDVLLSKLIIKLMFT